MTIYCASEARGGRNLNRLKAEEILESCVKDMMVSAGPIAE